MPHTTGPGLRTVVQAARRLVDEAQATSKGYTISYDALVALESALDRLSAGAS